MAYTVKKVAKLSGVSVRTLHFYDEIDLLKPAFLSEKGHRYYEEEQLLLLQQILFFRELGFKLSDIQRIMGAQDFDKLTMLKSHRTVLQGNVEQTQQLIQTLDKTVAHLEGRLKMKEEELYYGFNSQKQKEYEKEVIERGWATPEEIKAWHAKNPDMEKFKRDGMALNQDLVKALKDGLKPESQEVQALIKRHYDLCAPEGSKERYLGLSQLYCEDPRFRKFYEWYDPNMPEFLASGMREFVKNELN